jgi:uncharacterized UBP type Zn finger protein
MQSIADLTNEIRELRLLCEKKEQLIKTLKNKEFENELIKSQNKQKKCQHTFELVRVGSIYNNTPKLKCFSCGLKKEAPKNIKVSGGSKYE